MNPLILGLRRGNFQEGFREKKKNFFPSRFNRIESAFVTGRDEGKGIEPLSSTVKMEAAFEKRVAESCVSARVGQKRQLA